MCLHFCLVSVFAPQNDIFHFIDEFNEALPEIAAATLSVGQSSFGKQVPEFLVVGLQINQMDQAVAADVQNASSTRVLARQIMCSQERVQLRDKWSSLISEIHQLVDEDVDDEVDEAIAVSFVP